MTYFPHRSPRADQPLLDPHTFQALLWLAHGPHTAAQMAARLHLSTQSAGRRLSHLHSLGLARPSNPGSGRKGTRGAAFSLTEQAAKLINHDQS